MSKNKAPLRTPSPRPIDGTRSTLSPFAIGDKVEYIGNNPQLRRQYAGTLKIWEFGRDCDSDKCTCLKPDGRTTSWIEYGEVTYLSA